MTFSVHSITIDCTDWTRLVEFWAEASDFAEDPDNPNEPGDPARYRAGMATHTYRTVVAWAGSTGSGYRAYSRRHHASAPPAAEVALSADRHFRGDEDVMNPEQLVVMAASSCQLLSFLALAARAGIDVVDYEDEARGFMSDAGGQPMSIDRIELAPVVHVAPGTDHEAVRALAQEAHHSCYVANSLKSVVTLTPTVQDA